MLQREKEIITTKYLSENSRFKNGIPSDYIIFKNKPGLGATYGELKYDDRNSIILEPNTPVLAGKRDAVLNGIKVHPDILVVFKGVEVDSVQTYLESSVFPKKILCTPEAYLSKVRLAILNSEMNLYQDFFMLLDECDRLIKDVDFRKTITLPMQDFFKFKSKAMISATAIEPSDERFQQNSFKILELIPEHQIRQPLDLIQTNNIVESLKNTLNRNDNKQTFIFINSPTVALTLIRRLDIEEDSKIYTSSKGVQLLKKKHDFIQATTTGNNFVKYNFLTSRYYSAVDIELNEQPAVIMITDILRRAFTMLDPYTDTIQIIGRFRNGVRSASHITNFKEDMEWKTPDDAVKFIEDSFSLYEKIRLVTQEHNVTDGEIETGKQALEGTAVYHFIDQITGKLNTFMTDNYVLDQNIINSYTHIENLKASYEKTDYFVIKYFSEFFDINDAALLILEDKSKTQQSNEVIAKILQNYTGASVSEILANAQRSIFQRGDTRETIQKEYPEIVEIFDTIGFYRMEELQFDSRKMLTAMKTHKKKNELNNADMCKEIHGLYNIGDEITRKDAKASLQGIYTKYRITAKATGRHITNYFEAELNPRRDNSKVYVISGYKN